MSDYAGVLQTFSDYLELAIIHKGREEITNDDIDDFLEDFLDTKKTFFFPYGGSAYLKTGNAEDPNTGEKAYDMADKTTSEAETELRPILVKVVKETYGDISAKANAFEWDPTPRSVDEWASIVASDLGIEKEQWVNMERSERLAHPATIQANIKAAKIKSRTNQYFDKVLPFMVRKTMHHPILTGGYSATSDTKLISRNDEHGQEVILNSEEEIQSFLSTKTYLGPSFMAGKHEALKYLFWRPSITGKNVRMAVIDLDNPAKISHKDMVMSVRRIVTTLRQNNHPTLIVYTGGAFHIWIGDGNQKLGDMRDTKDYLTRLLYPMVADSRERAMTNNQLWFDTSTLSSTQPIRMLFSLHFPTPESSSDKKFTGLAAVPISLEELDKFEPTLYAHPEEVAANFEDYSRLAAHFFDRVEIGQDYESTGELESTPVPQVVEGSHKDYDKLQFVHNPTTFTQVQPDDIVDVIGKEEKVFAYTPARGVDCILEYRQRGGFKFNGKLLQVDKTLRQTSTVEPIHSILVTRNGIVIHSDYITRNIERYCEAKGITELTLVGQVVLDQVEGSDADEHDLLGLLVQPEQDAVLTKRFRFIVNYIASYNGEEVPLESMDEEVLKINTNRITPGPVFEFTKPIGRKLKQQYMSIRGERRGNRMVVMGEENYFVSSKQKAHMVIMGISKTSKDYIQDTGELGPVFVGFGKRSAKLGMEYHIINKASIALKGEDRKKLKDLVYGEVISKEDEEKPRYQNIIPISVRNDDLVNVLEVCEPKVVVEVEYDDVSNTMLQTLGFYYREDRGRKAYRPITGKLKWVTKLINCRITNIREELNASYLSDIDYRQEPLMEITATPPKGMGIEMTLPNPLRRYDIALDSKSTPLGETPNLIKPYYLRPKTYKKFRRLAKKDEFLGFVRGKRLHYIEYDDWALFGDNPELEESTFTVVSINQKFRLRGIDVINATKLCVDYGVNWHLVIDPEKFWWIHCELQNNEFRLRRDDKIAGGDDSDISKALTELLSVVTTAYPPKDEVIALDGVPGFDITIHAVEMGEVKSNPAFFGVPNRLNQGDGAMYHTIVDTESIPEGEEPKHKLTKFGVVDVNYFGGRRTYPALGMPLSRADTTRDPPEFAEAYKRAKAVERGKLDPQDTRWRLFLDDRSLVKGLGTPYYMVTNMPFASQNAVDDPRGYGADGISTVTMGRKLSAINSFNDQMDSHLLDNHDQSKEDLKITLALANKVPGDPDSSSPNYRRADTQYIKKMDEVDGLEKESLKSIGFTGTAEMADRLNPPVKENDWNLMVNKYIGAYDEWEQIDEAKETWENYSKGMFPTWAVKVLEKERLMRDASSKYALTDEEVAQIDSTFGVMGGEGLLDSALDDLYEEQEKEEEEEDEIEEFDPDDDTEYETED